MREPDGLAVPRPNETLRPHRSPAVSENETMTDSGAAPALSAAETQAAETLLAAAWGERAEVRAAELIWNRRPVVRLQVGAD